MFQQEPGDPFLRCGPGSPCTVGQRTCGALGPASLGTCQKCIFSGTPQTRVESDTLGGAQRSEFNMPTSGLMCENCPVKCWVNHSSRTHVLRWLLMVDSRWEGQCPFYPVIFPSVVGRTLAPNLSTFQSQSLWTRYTARELRLKAKRLPWNSDLQP